MVKLWSVAMTLVYYNGLMIWVVCMMMVYKWSIDMVCCHDDGLHDDGLLTWSVAMTMVCYSGLLTWSLAMTMV